MNSRHVYSLDLLKLILAYVIAFFHCDMTISPGPTVTVQVFFIISGFFLGKKYYSVSFPDPQCRYRAWDYTLDHVKKIYPHYFLSWAVFFLYLLTRSVLVFFRSPSFAQLQEIFRFLYNQIPDLFLVQSSHFFHDSINYPLWQLSALLISGYFIYAALCHNERLSREILFPAAILMIKSLLVSGVCLWDNYGFFYLPLLRALSPLCLGVLTYYFSTTKYFAALRRHSLSFSLAGAVSLLCLFCYADRANIFLISTPILILSCMEPGSLINRIFDRPCFRGAGALSLAIYMNHSFVARVLCALLLPRLAALGLQVAVWQKGLIYFFMLTVYSIFTLWLINRWSRRAAAAQAPVC